jgi:phosphatidylinositol alpha-1,6-mannosyltransferase
VIGNTCRDEFFIAETEQNQIPNGLEGKTVLLTVGRLDGRQRHKGHDKVIQCLARIRRKHPDILYVIVGDGSDRERLQKLATQCDAASMVRFAGRVPDRELADYYRAADLFVMPSTGDGIGIVFLEAMACGTSVLGIDAGGVRDAMADGDLGLVVQDAEFEEALEHALSLPKPLRAELSNRLRARFGRKVFHDRIGAVVKRLAA